MSFMPNPGSTVLLKDGRTAVVSMVTPDGKGDFAIVDGRPERITAWDIAEIVHEEHNTGSDQDTRDS